MGGVDKVKRQRDQGGSPSASASTDWSMRKLPRVGAISGVGEYNDNGELTN